MPIGSPARAGLTLLCVTADDGGPVSATDVLLDAAELGAVASESNRESRDLLKLLKVFKDVLLANIGDDDSRGLMAGTFLSRNGKDLRTGVVLVLQDRILLGWMKGMLKKPVVEAILLSAVATVERGKKATPGRSRVSESIVVKAGTDTWELLCSPDVAPDAPLYRMVAELIAGEQTMDGLPTLPGSASS